APRFVVIDLLVVDLTARAFTGLAVGYEEPDHVRPQFAQRRCDRLRRAPDGADEQDRPLRLLSFMVRGCFAHIAPRTVGCAKSPSPCLSASTTAPWRFCARCRESQTSTRVPDAVQRERAPWNGSELHARCGARVVRR